MNVKYEFDEKAEAGVVDGLAENQKTDDANADDANADDANVNDANVNNANAVDDDAVDDAGFLAYINKQGKTEFKSIDEYKESLKVEVTKEVVKAPEYDDETSAYLRFKSQNPDKGLADWTKLNVNLEEQSDMNLALDKIQRDNQGMKLTEGQAMILLANELGIDAEDFEDMSEKDKLNLTVIANKHKQVVKAEQEKYKQPVQESTEAKDDAQPEGEKVLVNGVPILKADYDRERQEYLTKREEAVSSIDKYNFSIEIDGKDGKSKLDIAYVPTDEDKQSMLSTTESLDNILPMFLDDKGELNHKSYNESIGFWANPANREKAINSISKQAYSAGVEAVLKSERNIDFDNKTIPPKARTKEDGYGEVGAKRQASGMTVKYPFNG